MQSQEVAFTRDQHRANAARCRFEERRLRTLNGPLAYSAVCAAQCWRESARTYDEMADFLDSILAAQAHYAARAHFIDTVRAWLDRRGEKEQVDAVA